MPSALENIHPDLRGLARPISELNEDPANANSHNDLSCTALVSSFTRFGQRKPLVVRREGMIVEAGNGALRSLRDAGWTHLACVVCDDDKPTATAYALADNQTARLSEWNFEQLKINTAELLDADYDLGTLGFSGEELANLAGGLQEIASASEEPAELSQPAHIPDIEKLSGGGSDASKAAGAHTLIPHMSWGKTRVPMTDDELAALDLAFKEHMDTFGSPFGFISSLLESE